MVWIVIGFLVVSGIGMILARHELTPIEEAIAGNRLHPGCVIAQGIVILLLAGVFCLAYLSGIFP